MGEINFTDYSWMDDEESTPELPPILKTDTLYGSCILSIHMESKEDYLRWKYYCEPKRKWDFNVSFPTNLQATFEFHTVQDVNLIAQKIVQALQLGFNVYSARWQLKEYKSQLDQSL